MGVQIFGQAGHVLAAGGGQEGAAGGASMLPLLVIGGALILFMVWSNRRRQKQAETFRSRLRPGQRVQLLGGMLGTLVTTGDREVFIELAPGVVVTAVPQAVQAIVEDPEAAQELPEDVIESEQDSDDDTDR